MSDIKLIEVLSVTQSFVKPDGGNQKILDKINLTLKEGEILALLGKSGGGKSTLLKIIAELVEPTHGKVKFNSSIADSNFGISMIFQSFALFPWLSVLENVELGLEALDIPKKERQARALEAINLIGLNGFESAMPREISGGMKQRVGFARALVVEPKVLLMDEAFSALDVLTSDTLKSDFLDLWIGKKTPLKGVLMVTHSIEEAVMMADRVLILASDPGHIVSELKINLPRPRNMQSTDFHATVDKIYSQLASAIKSVPKIINQKIKESDIVQNLLFVSPNQLAAVASALLALPYKGSGDLATLAKTLHIKTFDLLHIAEALNILKFAIVTDGHIKLSKIGKIFANSDLKERKKIFAEELLENVPLVAYILKILHERPNNKAPKARFLTYLEDYLSHEQAMAALKNIIIAGRYADIFSYDDDKQIFSLGNQI